MWGRGVTVSATGDDQCVLIDKGIAFYDLVSRFVLVFFISLLTFKSREAGLLWERVPWE